MAMFKMLLIMVMLMAASNSACNNPTGSSGNNQPEIREILVSPVPVKVDKWTDITAVATDKDGDILTYFWSSSEGEFFIGKTAINPTLWKVLNPGTHTITCTVSDGKDTASKSISVDVTN